MNFCRGSTLLSSTRSYECAQYRRKTCTVSKEKQIRNGRDQIQRHFSSSRFNIVPGLSWSKMLIFVPRSLGRCSVTLCGSACSQMPFLYGRDLRGWTKVFRLPRSLHETTLHEYLRSDWTSILKSYVTTLFHTNLLLIKFVYFCVLFRECRSVIFILWWAIWLVINVC